MKMQQHAKRVLIAGGIAIAALFLLLTFSCQQPATPPRPAEYSFGPGSQWFCKTVDGIQTNDTSTAAPRAVGFKDNWWPVGYQFKVGFIGGNDTQKALVKEVCADWAKVANVSFTFPASGPYDIRIAFNPNDGAWSYVGIQVRNITTGPTMNLGWLAKDAYLHEFGHTLGLLHEHQNPTAPIRWNEAQVIKDLSGPPNNWSEATIRYNVLNPYPLPNVITTALDRLSIMMYPIPQSWTLDGFSSPGGQFLSPSDKEFIATRYPFAQPPTTGNVTLRKGQVDTLLQQQAAARVALDAAVTRMKVLQSTTERTFGRKQ